MNRVDATPVEYELSILKKDAYLFFLNSAKERGFSFFKVKDIKKIRGTQHNIILRHDVDLSLKFAFEMAKAEQEESIFSTYYVMVDGSFYNILTPSSLSYIKKIKKMGHEIGLHFDTSCYNDIPHQIKILESIIEEKVYSISQHNPVNVGFSKDKISGIIDAYTLDNAVPNLEYISDSGMMWRDYSFNEGINLDKNLYILAHPISWMNSKNDLISIIREVESTEIQTLERSFNQFVNGHIEYYKTRRDVSDK